MPREFSAGGVVVRQMRGRWYVAAIVPAGKTGEGGEKAVLALPKGLVDSGETPEQTALREVREETGVEAELVAKLDDIRYVYTRSWSDGARVFKVVSFYLFRYCSGSLGEIAPEMRQEVAAAEWVPLEEAPSRLSYRSEKQVVEKAARYLAEHGTG